MDPHPILFLRPPSVGAQHTHTERERRKSTLVAPLSSSRCLAWGDARRRRRRRIHRCVSRLRRCVIAAIRGSLDSTDQERRQRRFFLAYIYTTIVRRIYVNIHLERVFSKKKMTNLRPSLVRFLRWRPGDPGALARSRRRMRGERRRRRRRQWWSLERQLTKQALLFLFCCPFPLFSGGGRKQKEGPKWLFRAGGS